MSTNPDSSEQGQASKRSTVNQNEVPSTISTPLDRRERLLRIIARRHLIGL